ncbi:MAG TPA: protein kinase [Pyrinomonadaceae bacterium]|nr:protein kinase [Pyrinomonadaceae bacterium]
MDIDRWQQIEAVFNQALAVPLAEREPFLITACGDDQDLRAELDSLLSEVRHTDPFLSETNFTLGADLLRRDSESLVGQTLGSYTLVRRLGQGGMGEVYLAHDERLGRKVALKLLPRLIVENEERARRFKHEARAASAISHPNVASVYEIGEAEGRLFIAMEMVDGPTLRDRLEQSDLTVGEAVELTMQVAAGIAAAHAQGIIHRDIKPENIMIRRDGLVKVVDFGLAKLSEPAAASTDETQFNTRITRAFHTEPGLLLGTATYMSPEQARGQHVDARTDIWSLGVVFYEMLAGKPPFHGATNSDVIAEILKTEPSLLVKGFRGFPRSATQLISQALGKDRKDRYATTADLLNSLHQLHRELEAEALLNVSLPLPKNAVETADRENHESTLGEPNKSKRLATRDSSISPEVSGRSGASTRRSRWLLFSAGLLVAAAMVTGLVLVRSRLTWRPTGAHAAMPLEVVHLTTNGRVKDAAVSPDGRLLTYVPSIAGKQSLRIKDLSSGEDWEILPPDLVVCWGMRFALNNQSLFYVSKQAGGTVNVLYRVPVRGGPSEKLVVNIDSPPGLSPDGMEIAFVRSYPVQHRDSLIVANVDGSDEREILVRKHPDKLVGAGVSWSPDGKMIAVGATRQDNTEGAVLAVRLDSGLPAEVTPWMWAEIAGIVWVNDGRTILFSGQKPGSTALQIWKVTYPGGQITQVTSDENEYEEATPGPNMLVATERYEVANLWSTDQANGLLQLTNDGHSGIDGLAVTSTGRIVYTQGESFASQLWSMNLDGSNRMLLTRNAGIHPSVSSDGKTIAYVAFEGGHHVWMVDSDGQNNHQLTFGGGENYADIAPDGQWVFYVSRDKNRGTLWKIAATGGEPVQLTFAGIILNPLVSPDGKKIACTFRGDEGDKWKLAILPSDGGEPLKTFAFPSPFYQVVRWTPDSKAVTYLDQANGVQNIWRQPLDGGAPVKLTNFDEDRIWHYDWAPSGRQFVLSRGGRRRDIVMIKNVH